MRLLQKIELIRYVQKLPLFTVYHGKLRLAFTVGNLLFQFNQVLQRELSAIEKDKDSFIQDFSEVRSCLLLLHLLVCCFPITLKINCWICGNYVLSGRLQWYSGRMEVEAGAKFIWRAALGSVHCQEKVIWFPLHDLLYNMNKYLSKQKAYFHECVWFTPAVVGCVKQRMLVFIHLD